MLHARSLPTQHTELQDTGVHGDPPPKITLTFQGQNYGAAVFLTPINQPYPQDITFLYTFTLDGTLVSTYNSTLPRASSQPPAYTWSPTIVFITIPNPGTHTLEIDVHQGPMKFDQFQFFLANSTSDGVGGGSSGAGLNSGGSTPTPSVNNLNPSISASGALPTNTGSLTNGGSMLNLGSSTTYSATAILGLFLYLLRLYVGSQQCRVI